MGERERQDGLKVLNGEKIKVSTRFGLLDFILYPYRAYKQKKRQEKIRQQMLRSVSCESGYDGNDEQSDTEVK